MASLLPSDETLTHCTPLANAHTHRALLAWFCAPGSARSAAVRRQRRRARHASARAAALAGPGRGCSRSPTRSCTTCSCRGCRCSGCGRGRRSGCVVVVAAVLGCRSGGMRWSGTVGLVLPSPFCGLFIVIRRFDIALGHHLEHSGRTTARSSARAARGGGSARSGEHGVDNESALRRVSPRKQAACRTTRRERGRRSRRRGRVGRRGRRACIAAAAAAAAASSSASPIQALLGSSSRKGGGALAAGTVRGGGSVTSVGACC